MQDQLNHPGNQKYPFGKRKSSYQKPGPIPFYQKKKKSKAGPEEALVLDILPRHRPSMLPLIASPAALMEMTARHPDNFASGFSTLTHRNADRFKVAAKAAKGFSYVVSPGASTVNEEIL